MRGDTNASSVEIWRVPAWIRMLAVAQSLGWIALVGVLGFRGDESVLTFVFLAVFVVGVPYFALRPSIRIGDGGALTLRGWVSCRRVNVAHIRRLTMTPLGLEMTFDDGTTYTTVIFQATRSLGRPRVLDFVDALQRTRGSSPRSTSHEIFRERGLNFRA